MTPKSIVDQRLPDGDGFDVLRAAREAGIPVIMVTGMDRQARARLTSSPTSRPTPRRRRRAAPQVEWQTTALHNQIII
jgi:CheY-like chemotaxis protein